MALLDGKDLAFLQTQAAVTYDKTFQKVTRTKTSDGKGGSTVVETTPSAAVACKLVAYREDHPLSGIMSGSHAICYFFTIFPQTLLLGDVVKIDTVKWTLRQQLLHGPVYEKWIVDAIL